MMTMMCAGPQRLALEANPTSQLSGAAARSGDQLSGATPDDLGKPADPRSRAARAGEKGEADDYSSLRLLCKARPVVEHLAPFAGETPVDLAPLAKVLLSGAFSLMCTLRMDDRIDDWARVFDFSMKPDEDSIAAGAIERTNDFHFTVFQGSRPVRVRVNDFFELGREMTMLCTVSSSGHMMVFKDGVLVGENLHGAVPAPVERPHMIVGSHFHFTNQAFRGSLSNVKVWDQEVSWAAAMEVPPPVPESCTDSTAGSGSDTASGADSVADPDADSVGGDSDAHSEPEAGGASSDSELLLPLDDPGATADPGSCDGSEA